MADGSIMPPSSFVCFNSSITSNDGLLAHSLMKREAVSFEEAQIKVAEIIDDLKSTLREDRELSIGKIGVLQYGDDATVSFTPLRSAEPKGFGKVSAEEPEAVSTLKSETEATEARRFDTARNFYIPVNKRFAKVAASLILVVCLAATYVVPSLRNSAPTSVSMASVMPLMQQTQTESRNAQTAPRVNNIDATTGATTSESAKAKQTDKDYKYYLIVASMPSKDECKKFIATSPSSASLKIVSGKKMNRVYYAASNTKEDLLKILNDSDFKSKFPQAWIWEK